jgi:hypothetical protein
VCPEQNKNITFAVVIQNNKDIEGEILSVSGDSVISSKSSRVYTRTKEGRIISIRTFSP